MAKTDHIITLRLSAKTRVAALAMRALYPAVWLGIISADRAAAFAMRFVRVDAQVEGWTD